MNNTCEAIILRQQEYKDNDMIVSVYTKEYGKMSFCARGIKKMKSKNASACSLYMASRFLFDYKEGKDIQLLKSAEGINTFYHLYDSLEKQAVAAILVEVSEKLNSEHHELFYELLYRSLKALNESDNEYGVLGFFMAKCCIAAGIMPSVDACVRCGDTRQIATISLCDGGFICASCYDEKRHRKYDLDTLRTFRFMMKSKMDKIETVLEFKIYKYQEIAVILEWFSEYSGIHLQSLQFLEKIVGTVNE